MAGNSGGLLRRVVAGIGSLFNRREVVGIDIHGNKYLRWKETNLDGDMIEKRIIKTPDGSYNPSLVPPEWMRWLQKTRLEPPSKEEIEEAQKRKLLMKQRVMILEAEEAKRRLQAEGMRSTAGGPNLDRFVQQLSARGYAPNQAPPGAPSSGEEPSKEPETQLRPDQAPPQAEPPPAGQDGPRGSSGGPSPDFQPGTWKPGG